MRDVLLERAVGDDLVAVGRHAGVVGETLRMEAAGSPDGGLFVRVIESRPTVADGTLRHRLVLQLTGAPSAEPRAAGPAANRAPMLAVLTKEIPVRVLNCSSSGCLLECPAPLEKGTVASLRLVIQGEELVDHLNVVRCQPIEGGSCYYAGAEFLWTAAPTRQSLRLGIARFHEQTHTGTAVIGRA